MRFMSKANHLLFHQMRVPVYNWKLFFNNADDCCDFELEFMFCVEPALFSQHCASLFSHHIPWFFGLLLGF